MEMFNAFEMMKSIAVRSIQNQERNPEDSEQHHHNRHNEPIRPIRSCSHTTVSD